MQTYMKVNKILHEQDGDAALAALGEAKGLARQGLILELIDYLIPEDKDKRPLPENVRRSVKRRD